MNDICLIVVDYLDGRVAIQAISPEYAEEMYDNCCKTADKSVVRFMLVTIKTDDKGNVSSEVVCKKLPQVKKSDKKTLEE